MTELLMDDHNTDACAQDDHHLILITPLTGDQMKGTSTLLQITDLYCVQLNKIYTTGLVVEKLHMILSRLTILFYYSLKPLIQSLSLSSVIS